MRVSRMLRKRPPVPTALTTPTSATAGRLNPAAIERWHPHDGENAPSARASAIITIPDTTGVPSARSPNAHTPSAAAPAMTRYADVRTSAGGPVSKKRESRNSPPPVEETSATAKMPVTSKPRRAARRSAAGCPDGRRAQIKGGAMRGAAASRGPWSVIHSVGAGGCTMSLRGHPPCQAARSKVDEPTGSVSRWHRAPRDGRQPMSYEQ